MKVGIIGDKGYTDRNKIKQFIFKLKQKGNIEIVGCGSEWHIKNDERYIKNWTGNCVRNFTLDMELPYHEFPPSHHAHNMYCVLKPYKYGKPFKVWNYNQRDKEIVKYCDRLVFFRSRTKSNKELDFIIKEVKKLDKPYVICGNSN